MQAGGRKRHIKAPTQQSHAKRRGAEKRGEGDKERKIREKAIASKFWLITKCKYSFIYASVLKITAGGGGEENGAAVKP